MRLLSIHGINIRAFEMAKPTRRLVLGASACVCLGITGELAFGAGLALREQSVRSGSMAMAADGVSVGDAASLMANPATMTELEKHTFSGTVKYATASIGWAKGSGAEITDGSGEEDAQGGGGFVPGVFGVHPINKQIYVGWGISPTTAAAAKYKDEWFGRYHTTETAITVTSIDVAGAYKLNKMIAFSGGLSYEMGSMLIKQAANIGGAAAQSSGDVSLNNNHDSRFKFEGDSGGAVGATLGILVNPTKTVSIGLGFRQLKRHTVKGDLAWFDDTTVAASTRGQAKLVNPLLASSDSVESKLVSPQVFNLGAKFGAGTSTRFFVNLNQTKWSSNGRLALAYNGSEDASQLNWKDSRSFSAGGEFDLSSKITLRGGLGIEPSITSESDRTAKSPADGDRTVLAFGGSYTASKFAIDAGLSTYIIEDSVVDDKSDPTKPFSGTGSASIMFFMVGGSYML